MTYGVLEGAISQAAVGKQISWAEQKKDVPQKNKKQPPASGLPPVK